MALSANGQAVGFVQVIWPWGADMWSLHSLFLCKYSNSDGTQILRCHFHSLFFCIKMVRSRTLTKGSNGSWSSWLEARVYNLLFKNGRLKIKPSKPLDEEGALSVSDNVTRTHSTSTHNAFHFLIIDTDTHIGVHSLHFSLSPKHTPLRYMAWQSPPRIWVQVKLHWTKL